MLYDEYKHPIICCCGYRHRTNNDKLHDQLPLQSSPSKVKTEDSNTSKELGTVCKKLSINLVTIIPFLVNNVTSEDIVKREQEYRTAMQRNLNHPLVNIHVLTTDPQETIRHFNNFTNQEKMIVTKVNIIIIILTLAYLGNWVDISIIPTIMLFLCAIASYISSSAFYISSSEHAQFAHCYVLEFRHLLVVSYCFCKT